MGNYRVAVQDFLNGSDIARYGAMAPTITLHENFGALKYGVGYNMEQDLTGDLRVFGRFGWDDGATESFAYTEVDQTVELGGDFAGARWHRSQDKFGLAVVSNAIKKDHQNYLQHGGLGFLLGDGNLTYGRENIVESYYTLHAWHGMFTRSTCSTSQIQATTAPAAPPGSDHCACTWIFKDRDQGLRRRIEFGRARLARSWKLAATFPKPAGVVCPSAGSV